MNMQLKNDEIKQINEYAIEQNYIRYNVQFDTIKRINFNFIFNIIIKINRS